ncbi:MAG TPA: nuclear transport factor 2 family protein [Chloroflexota bacterium]|nr:nuclear transport factor 2 family protein [Chloroflexota bacterium]
MTGSQDTLTVARSYSEAISARDWDRLRNVVLAPDVEAWSHSAQFLERGPDEIIAALQKTSGVVTDTRLEIVNQIAEGDQAVLELRFVGTAFGDPNAKGVPAEAPSGEGRVVTLSTCHVYKVRDGKIVHLTTYSDRTWRFQTKF